MWVSRVWQVWCKCDHELRERQRERESERERVCVYVCVAACSVPRLRA